MVASSSAKVKLRNNAGFETGRSGLWPGFLIAKRPMAIAIKLQRIMTKPTAGVQLAVLGAMYSTPSKIE